MYRNNSLSFSFTIGHLDCIQVLAIMNKTGINIHIQFVFFFFFMGTYIFNSFRYIPRSMIAGPYSKSMFNFIRDNQTDPKLQLAVEQPLMGGCWLSRTSKDKE